MTFPRFLLCASLVVLAAAAAGCARHAAQEQDQTSRQASQPATPGLAELSVEDRPLAEKQRVCPVSGELLGAMGKPFKTTANGRTVFLCCDGCEQELKSNPDKYLEKLDNAKQKK
jgi:YHS domain-containing protein